MLITSLHIKLLITQVVNLSKITRFSAHKIAHSFAKKNLYRMHDVLYCYFNLDIQIDLSFKVRSY